MELKPGESQTVEFKLDHSAFEYWSPETKEWTFDPGTFEVQVGASSRDIRLKAPEVASDPADKLGKDAQAGPLQRGGKYPG